MASEEVAKIRKEAARLTNELYSTPSTSLLQFHFEPKSFDSSEKRLQKCSIEHSQIEGKDIYIFDDFFYEKERQEIRDYSENATFNKTIYADYSSQKQGEEPARAMDNKAKWQFFINPPDAIQEMYKLLSHLASMLQADVSTLPWDLSDGHITASAVATNRIEKLSKESMQLGRHADYNTETGIPFAIPQLFSKEKNIYPSAFINGDASKPWLVSIMFYATDEKFKPEYGLGTAFYTKDKTFVFQSECRHMRFVLFEGDIIHGIEESHMPADVKTWRVSYVFKLLLNPMQEGISLKNLFYDQMKKLNLVEKK